MTGADDLDPTASLCDLFIIATAPAGWYEVSHGMRRWFDGRSWTDYYAPVLPVVAESLPAATPAASNDSGGSRELTGTSDSPVDLTNHGFHLIMTVMTLAAWTPVWLAAVAVTSVRSSARRHGARHHGDPGQRALSMRSTRRSKSLSASSIPLSPSL
ncbi:DUF2510 domain-containing protein [Marisediminicola sp. LYQ134]|uniref:DUF2510 domain-containing protein n=1 Tax=Marisediminicola sp. LYQ134 TaxID=3391061 RepID=UPI0039830082